MFRKIKKRLRTATFADIANIKLSVFFFTLFLVGLFPEIIIPLEEWKWVLLAIAVLFSIKPVHKFWIQR